MKDFKLLSDKAVVAGLCAAVAYNLSVPAWIVRLTFLMLCFFTRADLFVMLYLLLWVAMPSRIAPKDYGDKTGE